MNIKRIETLENWLILKAALKEKGYTAWQFQYYAEHPEGYQVKFFNGSKDVMVITHNSEVEADMMCRQLSSMQ